MWISLSAGVFRDPEVHAVENLRICYNYKMLRYGLKLVTYLSFDS